MGSKVVGKSRRLRRLSPTLAGLDARKDIRKENKGVRTGIHQQAEAGVRTGATQAKRDAAKSVAAQQKKEASRLLEATSKVETKRALALSGKAGRKSLLKTSPGGRALNLGGTNG